jgi:hypothetical protein
MKIKRKHYLIAAGVVAASLVTYIIVRSIKGKKQEESGGVSGGSALAETIVKPANKPNQKKATSKPSPENISKSNKQMMREVGSKKLYNVKTTFTKNKYSVLGSQVSFKQPLVLKMGDKHFLTPKQDGDFTYIHEGVSVVVPREHIQV